MWPNWFIFWNYYQCLKTQLIQSILHLSVFNESNENYSHNDMVLLSTFTKGIQKCHKSKDRSMKPFFQFQIKEYYGSIGIKVHFL